MLQRAVMLGALWIGTGTIARAQDTTALVQAAALRHSLTLDTARIRAFQRTYDIAVLRADSTMIIGQRDVSFAQTSYANAPAWLLVEARSGMVPAAESLYFTPDMRLLHWGSALGLARMSIEFSGDSIYGVAAGPGGRHNVILEGRPDLVVSLAMIEALMPLLPLNTTWSDSVHVLSVDPTAAAITPGALSVVGEEEVTVDSAPPRPAWVVALRTEGRNALMWVEKDTGVVRRLQLDVPVHVGKMMEIRQRPPTSVPLPPPDRP